jgi:hypothetical protein
VTQYTVTFRRVGRNHDVAPLTTEAGDADQLAEQIHRHARPHLRSRDIEVHVDLEQMRGQILAGFNNGGDFTIAEGGDQA